MNIILRNINWTKKSGILIIGFCLTTMLLAQIVKEYRGTWIYRNGSPTLLFAFYGGVLLSLVNTIFLFIKHKSNLKGNLIWIFLSAIPFLYIGIMMAIAMIKTY